MENRTIFIRRCHGNWCNFLRYGSCRHCGCDTCICRSGFAIVNSKHNDIIGIILPFTYANTDMYVILIQKRVHMNGRTPPKIERIQGNRVFIISVGDLIHIPSRTKGIASRYCPLKLIRAIRPGLIFRNITDVPGIY